MFDSLLYPMVCQPDSGSTSDRPAAASPKSGEDLGEPDETWDAEPADSDPSSTDSAALSVLMDESVEEAVERVASSWEDTDERLKKRKAAAL